MYINDNGLQDAVQTAILESDRIDLKDCRIKVIDSDEDKKRNGHTVYADTRKLTDLMCFLTGYDFVITFYERSRLLGEKAMRTLIEHELMHIGYETTKKGVRKYIEPHDVQDFRAIIDQHGLDWVDEL